MDPIQSKRQLANTFLNDPLAHKKAKTVGLSKKELKGIDPTPKDGKLTQDDLFHALMNNKVVVDLENHKLSTAQEEINFVDPDLSGSNEPQDSPSQKRATSAPKDLFPGYHSQGVRHPDTTLTVNNQATYTPPAGMTYQEFVEHVDSPDDVAAFGRPFGSLLYNNDRAGGGEGPNGTQSPQETFDKMSAICRDIGQLQAHALQENGYNAIQIGYKSQGVLHAVATYEGKNGEGFGLVEYGRHYSPEDISKALGRPALSHEEALLAVRPEAKLINQYSRPEATERGHIESLYYTTGHKLYNETLRLKHENSASWNTQNGMEIEAALGEHWGMKIAVDTGTSADPTAKNAASFAVGYAAGDEDNGFQVSLGTQYRPNEGHHSVGGNVWEEHPAIVAGAHAEGRLTPWKFQLGENHQTYTRFSGDFTGALAFSKGEGTDGAGNNVPDKWGLDNGLSAGLSHAHVRVGQHFDGQLNDRLSYKSEVFVAPDILAMSYGYSTGGGGLYSNIGANASFHYEHNGFGAYVGGQVLAQQVNNLEATGVATGLSYTKGRFSISGDANLLDSPEGARLQTRQSVNYKITDKISAYGFATQESIHNGTHGTFQNPGGQSLGLGITGRF